MNGKYLRFKTKLPDLKSGQAIFCLVAIAAMTKNS